MIHIEGVSRRYGDLLAVDKVSAHMGEGEIVGLLGANGAGKSTLLKMLVGLIEPHEGEIRIGGLTLGDAHDSATKSAQRLIGYLPESSPTYPELSVIDYLMFVAKVRAVDRSRELSAIIQAMELQEVLAQPIGTLSRGFRQRVGLAQALMHRPPILILDEPTNGLDPLQTQALRQLIKDLARGQQGLPPTTIILSTHIMQEVSAMCTRVWLLKNGRLCLDQSLAVQAHSLRVHTSADDQAMRVIIGDHHEVVSMTVLSPGHYQIHTKRAVQDFSAWLTQRLIESGYKLYACWTADPAMARLDEMFTI